MLVSLGPRLGGVEGVDRVAEDMHLVVVDPGRKLVRGSRILAEGGELLVAPVPAADVDPPLNRCLRGGAPVGQGLQRAELRDRRALVGHGLKGCAGRVGGRDRARASAPLGAGARFLLVVDLLLSR